MRVRQHEKISQRYDELKRSDPCLDIDLVEHFWQRMDQVAANLKIDKKDFGDCFKRESVCK